MLFKNILLIDDDKDDQFFFKSAIAEIDKSISCNVANDGLQGYEYLQQHSHPDIIFLDLNMPVMNGIEFLRAIQPEIVKKIPIVIYSTSSYLMNTDELKELGARAFLTKPDDLNNLQLTLSYTLNLDLSAQNEEMIRINLKLAK